MIEYFRSVITPQQCVCVVCLHVCTFRIVWPRDKLLHRYTMLPSLPLSQALLSQKFSILAIFQLSFFAFVSMRAGRKETFRQQKPKRKEKNNEEILIEREKPLTMGFFQPLFPVAAAACAKDCLR